MKSLLFILFSILSFFNEDPKTNTPKKRRPVDKSVVLETKIKEIPIQSKQKGDLVYHITFDSVTKKLDTTLVYKD